MCRASLLSNADSLTLLTYVESWELSGSGSVQQSGRLFVNRKFLSHHAASGCCFLIVVVIPFCTQGSYLYTKSLFPLFCLLTPLPPILVGFLPHQGGLNRNETFFCSFIHGTAMTTNILLHYPLRLHFIIQTSLPLDLVSCILNLGYGLLNCYLKQLRVSRDCPRLKGSPLLNSTTFLCCSTVHTFCAVHTQQFLIS